MTPAPSKILVVGDVMIDVVVRMAGPLAPGSDVAAEIVERTGGSAATQAVWLARFGVAVDFVGRVGAGDAERLAAELTAEGVTPWLAADPVRPTGRLVALVDPSGERSFLTDRGANAGFLLSDAPREALELPDWVHLSGYTFADPASRGAAVDLMREVGESPVSVDAASAAPLRAMGAAEFLKLTSGASILFANADEAAALTGSDDPARQLDILREHYPLAVVKRGAAGAEAVSGVNRWSLPAPAAKVVDTTGAGDAFAAGFLSAKLAGDDVKTCLDRAVAAGAAATEFLGGRPPARA